MLIDTAILEKNITEIAKYDLESNNLFGSSYFVWQNGKEVLKKHFGSSDPEGKKPVDNKTCYRLASMTKPITAVAMLILEDKGLISLDDPVSKYIPEFGDIHIVTSDRKDLGKTKTPVTVLHCLTHTSGLGSIKPVEMTDDDRKNVSATLNCFINSGLDFEPFTVQAYSPFAAFDVLAAIAEKITGLCYEDFLKKEIFIPCGMPDTTFLPTDEQWMRTMTMHAKNGDQNSVGKTYPGCVFESFPCSHMLAGAGLISTIDDYAEFAKMLANKGKTGKGQLFSQQSYKKLCTPYVPSHIMPGNENWCLGMRVITGESYGTLPVGSFGWSGAYGSHFWVDPVNNICAVFMKNSRFDGGSGNCSAVRFEKAVSDSLIR